MEPTLVGGRPFTVADLEHAPDDGRRYEVVDGVLIVSAAPGRLHQRAVGRTYRLLDDACPDEFEVLVAPFGVVLGGDTELQPDVLVARRADLTDTHLPAPPALAVEILSPSSRIIDTHVKRERFERAGTPAFWVVDPVARPQDARLIAWELADDGRYRQVADVTGQVEYRALRPYPVRVRPADLVGTAAGSPRTGPVH
jgi:Uma2 family endonuclease